jgi:hypothetical protein
MCAIAGADSNADGLNLTAEPLFAMHKAVKKRVEIFMREGSYQRGRLPSDFV